MILLEVRGFSVAFFFFLKLGSPVSMEVLPKCASMKLFSWKAVGEEAVEVG